MPITYFVQKWFHVNACLLNSCLTALSCGCHRYPQDTECKLHCVKTVKIWSFFWFLFSHIWTEYGDLRGKSPYSVQIRENTDQKKLRIWTLFTQRWPYIRRSEDFRTSSKCLIYVQFTSCVQGLKKLKILLQHK